MSDKKIKAASDILSPIGKTLSIKVSAEHTPSEYFVDREGLDVWSSFKDRIVEKASTTKAGTSFELDSFKLEKSATDDEIEQSLPKDHIFGETEVCAIIAELISKQPKGEEGTLQNNGWANLFYTESCVVYVVWDSTYWRVSTWRRVDDRWDGDEHVFSPAR